MDSILVNTARGLMNLVHPMTGSTRSIRTLAVTAVANVQFYLKKGTWVFPVLGAPLKQRPDLIFKVRANPAREDGHWLITDAGTAVDVIANSGGARFNVPVDTQFACDFPIDSLMSMAVSAVVQDGTAPSAYCGLKDIVLYDQAQGDFFTDLRRSATKDFPCAVVAFESIGPADGTQVDTLNRRSGAGRRVALYKATYQINIFSSRVEHESIRRTEGLSILDQMMRYMSERNMSDDGDPVSHPGGVQILGGLQNAQAQEVFQKFDIYTLAVVSTIALNTIPSPIVPNQWLRACINVDKATAGKPALRMATDQCVDMNLQVPDNAIVDDNGIPILDDFGNFILFAG